jgi:ribosomal protein L11 methyltransferase
VCPGAERAHVLAALFAAGSQGVQEEGDALLTHFPPGTDVEDVIARVREASPGAALYVGSTEAVDWSRAWRHGVGAHMLGALTIAPPWLAAGHDPANTIVIDPGMAFGTGEHQTTRGVLRLMQRVVRPGDRVADLGAGSAVLAIAAVKLGAASAAAIEMDPDAIGNAEANVERNGVLGRVAVLEGDAATLLPLVAPVRVVLANILSSVLVELFPHIARALTPDGAAILSGILNEEREDMLAVLDGSGWRVVAEDREGLWWSTVVNRATAEPTD